MALREQREYRNHDIISNSIKRDELAIENYGSREGTSDFRLQTSDFRLQTSNIGSELR